MQQWRVVVMGWKNGVAYCQRTLETVLANVSEIAAGYVDDIIAGSDEVLGETTPDLLRKHDREIRMVLEALKQGKMVADIRKCKFFVKEVTFCGHVLTKGTMRPAPGKLLALEKWELPRTITALRGLLGFCNHHAAYCKNYAELAAPLDEKLKVGKIKGRKGSKEPVEWKKEDIEDFETLRKTLLGGLSLQVVNPDRPFVLRIDASGRAIGAVLEQLPEDAGRPTPEGVLKGQTIPVAFMSRKLAPSQARTWDTRDKEAYAIVAALEKWAGWIGLQPVLVLTDHKTLQSWVKETLSPPGGTPGRRARWHQKLSRFNLTVVHVPGKDNVAADALSRWAYPASQSFNDISWHGSKEDDEEMKRIIEEEKREEKACLVIRAKVRGTEQGSKFSFAKSSSRPSQSSRDAHPSIEPPSQDVATSSNTAKTTRPESGMSSDTRVPASGTSVPRKFEFSRSTETTHVLDEDWDDAYYASERWAEEWVVTQDPDRPEWPLGIKIYEHKMYWYEKLCVPESVTGRVIRAHHAEIGHVGGKNCGKKCKDGIISHQVHKPKSWQKLYLGSAKPVKHTIRRIYN